MTKISDIIRKNRPNLSAGSIRTYNSILNNLLRKLKSEDESIFEKKPTEVITALKDEEPKKRKTILSAIIVFIEKSATAGTIKKYRDLMLEDSNKSKQEDEQQEKTNTQKENWMSYEEVMKLYNNLENDTKHLFKKENLNSDEFQKLQNFVILSVMLLIPPRRLLDWTEMKLKNFDKDKDNYIDKNNFVFNIYKTSKFYGTQKVEMSNKLKPIIKKWISKNDNDYLFVDSYKNKLTPTKLNQRLNKIFDKKISVNMLRHIFISDKVLANVPKLEELKAISSAMGHSPNEQMIYKKF